MPAALLGLLAAYQLPGYDKIYSVTFVVILLTILVQAGTAGWLAKKLDLLEVSEEPLGRASLLDALLVDQHYSIIEIVPPKDVLGKTLLEAQVRARYGIYVIVVKHGKQVDIIPNPNRAIEPEDLWVVIGDSRRLEQILS